MSNAPFDLLVSGGTVIDGTGGPPFVADIAIRDGMVVAVGDVEGHAAKTIDATGLLVTPGFVDIHTHYDGQATWDDRLTPSSWHGVTTVVMGNCGVGFAPCRAADHDALVKLMEGVEDIPGVVLAEGLSWDWETFPEFLDAVDARPHDVDIAAYLPHGPLRVYVMGQRAIDLEFATAEDIEKMAALTRDALAAGAIGFSTSRTLNHRTADGNPTPSLRATSDELAGIADALSDQGSGVLQFVSDFDDGSDEMSMLRDLAASSGRPLSVSLAQSPASPGSWRDILDWIEESVADGVDLYAQVAGRPVGLMLGLEASLHPFAGCETYRSLADKPLAEIVVALRDPEVRESLFDDIRSGRARSTMLLDFDRMFILGDPPDYEQPPENTIAVRALAAGIEPMELALDTLLERDGTALLYFPFLNYADASLEPSLEMMQHDRTVLGLGDGGAHLGTICDASFTTHMLTHWARDRVRGDRVPVETVVKWHTCDTAEAVGLHDRGVLAPGYKADLNVIDYDALQLREPHMSWDLPAGGRRLLQRADGYRYAIVSGHVTYVDGQPTDALPGRLIRGPQPAPQNGAA